MDSKDYTAFNKLIDRYVSKLNGVNFIRYVGVDENKKCSIVLNYVNRTEDEDFYYGLHPKFSRHKFFSEILKGNIQTHEQLEKYLNKQKADFSLHKNQSKYEKAVFAQVLLRLASRFGIKMAVSLNTLEAFQEFAQQHPDIFIEDVTYKISSEKNNCFLTFLGIQTQKTKQLLTDHQFGFFFNKESNQFRFTQGDATSHTFLETNEVLKTKNPEDVVTLANGAVYYSGVMPRVVKIDKFEKFSNPNIQTICLHAERTTFSTLDALDYNDILLHPLLKPYRPLLNEFAQNEDTAQEVLFKEENMTSNGQMIAAINQYLDKSYNTHTVAVSGNLVTADDYLVIAQRGKATIDEGTFYCSVNGQSEFRDMNVNFYKESVEDDFPTLLADENHRNIFSGELSRETEAELNTNSLKRKWQFYGLSILGIQNTKKVPIQPRRMHFNILAFNDLDEDFLSIKDNFKEAIEGFENKRLEGIRIQFSDSRTEILKSYLSSSSKFIAENDSIITNAVAVPFLLLTRLNSSMSTQQIFENGLTSLIALAVLLNAGNDLVHFINKNYNKKQYVDHYRAVKNKQAIQLIDNAFKEVFHLRNAHPILYVMFGLYIYSLIK